MGAHEELIEGLEARAEVVVHESVEAIVAAVDAYRRGGPLVVAAIEHSVRRAFDVALEMWQTGEVPASVRELARLGIPPPELGIALEDVLEAYRIGSEVLWRHFSALARETDTLDKDFVLDAAATGYQLHHELSTAVTSWWLTAQRRAAPSREEIERAVLEGLLVAPHRPEDAARRARAIGIELSGRWVVSVGDVPRGAEPADVLSEVRGRLAAGAMAAIIRGQLVVATRPDDASDLAPEPLPVAGVGGTHRRATGLRRSYTEALEALEVAHRRGITSARFEHTWLERFLLGSVSARELADAVLGPLDELSEDKRTAALETLEAYLDSDGSATRASRLLHLHRQSVNYRLDRLREQFQGALDDPERRLALYLAVKARRLLAPRDVGSTGTRPDDTTEAGDRGQEQHQRDELETVVDG